MRRINKLERDLDGEGTPFVVARDALPIDSADELVASGSVATETTAAAIEVPPTRKYWPSVTHCGHICV